VELPVPTDGLFLYFCLLRYFFHFEIFCVIFLIPKIALTFFRIFISIEIFKGNFLCFSNFFEVIFLSFFHFLMFFFIFFINS
jgi:hypothetical protein